MKVRNEPAPVELVACEVCLKEVPKSEATVPEVADYVAYFCGLDCYQKWQQQAKAAQARQSTKPAA